MIRRGNEPCPLARLALTVAVFVAGAARAEWTTIDAGRGDVAVNVPPGVNPANPAPLAVMLHGYGGTGAIYEDYLGLVEELEAAGFLYAIPDGTLDTGGSRFWNATDGCCNKYDSTVDDVDYLEDLITAIDVAHGVRDVDVDDEIVEMFKQRTDFVLVPNLPDRGVATDMSWLSSTLPAAEVAELQAAAVDNPEAQTAFGIQARNLARLSDEGLTIALGSDGNDPWAAHVEMEDMVAAGMTPAEVITAATKNGADFLRLTDAGTISNGKRADFLVLEANPLDDITNTRRISAVYLQGEEVERTGASAEQVANLAPRED